MGFLPVSVLLLAIIQLAASLIPSVMDVRGASSSTRNDKRDRETNVRMIPVLGYMPPRPAEEEKSDVVKVGKITSEEILALEDLFTQSNNRPTSSGCSSYGRPGLKYMAQAAEVDPKEPGKKPEELIESPHPCDQVTVPVNHYGQPAEERGIWVLGPTTAPQCSVCLNDFKSPKMNEGKWEWELVNQCPQCKQLVGHAKCLDPWLKQKNTCPMCRGILREAKGLATRAPVAQHARTTLSPPYIHRGRSEHNLPSEMLPLSWEHNLPSEILPLSWEHFFI